jgi:hypothetical protein
MSSGYTRSMARTGELIGSNSALDKLVELGERKGFVTYEEVDDHMPDDVVSTEQIDSWLATLGEHGIEVVDGLGSGPKLFEPPKSLDMQPVEDIIARVFTSQDPVTGSKPSAHIAWVVFAHGTVFFSKPTDTLPASSSPAQIADAGRAALGRLGPVRAGSPSGDFSPVRLDDWFPEEPVWFVRFNHPNIATVVVIDAKPVDAGLEARRRRQRDYDEQTITGVRAFDGNVVAHADPQ